MANTISKEEQALINAMITELADEDEKMEKHYVTTTAKNIVSSVGNIAYAVNDLTYIGRLEVKRIKYNARKDLLTDGL